MRFTYKILRVIVSHLMARRAVARNVALGVLVAAIAPFTTGYAQTAATAVAPMSSAPTQAARADVARSVDGQVMRPDEAQGDSTGMRPAAGAWVTVHRVGKDTAGPVDSVRSSRTGRYQIAWRTPATDSAVYFASVTWDGIAYFSAPLRSLQATADEALITVFDTTSVVHPLSVKGRHLIVGGVDSLKMRTIIEVFELQNDSVQTLVSLDAANATPTWSIAIPTAAKNVRATQGDVPNEALTHAPGRVSVFAPIAPGLKQVAFTYQLHADDFPLQYRAENGAVVFEVLMEDLEGRVFGDGFQAVDAVTIEGRQFARFLSQDVADGSPVTIEVPSGMGGTKYYGVGVLVVVGFMLLLFLTRSLQRRANKHVGDGVKAPSLRVATNGRARGNKSETPLHERLAQEIVALDTFYSQQPSPSATVVSAYELRRAELKDALADALASGPNSR